MKNGLVISDLHLFAGRSQGHELIEDLAKEIANTDLLVLNGDTFDFRWSEVGDEEATLHSAFTWLETLLERFPETQINYILGNHDCQKRHHKNLLRLANKVNRLRIHPYFFQLDSSIFLHGDCANWGMSASKLGPYREAWNNDSQKGTISKLLYKGVDSTGLGMLFHHLYFQRNPTIARVERYLHEILPQEAGNIENCYFGHTHVPFTGHQRNSITYHNTGSAIRGMGFLPLPFQFEQ
ncbi:MAG: metallophosphoesterase [Verrucomicrobiaceae bacterium]